jgi:exosortase
MPQAVTLPPGLAALVVVLGAALLLWFSLPTLRLLNVEWVDGVDYSHGWLVLALSGFLVFREVRRAPLEPLQPSWVGMACLALVMLIMVAGHASTTLPLVYAPFPALWMAGVWAVAGAVTARRLLPALAYLYAAIPIWDLALGTLQKLTVAVVSVWIRMSTVPAFIEGNLIHLPSGTIEVAGGCAGLRYAVVALALAGFVALVQRHRLGVAVLLTLLGLALGLFSNWVRVFAMVLVGHYSQMQNYLIVTSHTNFGWVVFMVGMVPLFLLNRRLSPVTGPGGGDAIPRTVSAAPVGPGSLAAYASCMLLLAAGIALNHRVAGSTPAGGAVALTEPNVAGWTRVADWQDARTPAYVGQAAEVAGWYSDGVARVGAYMVDYPAQQQQHEVVFADNYPAGMSATVVARARVEVKSQTGRRLPFQELEVQDPDAGQRRLVWVGMRIAGELTSGSLMAKWLQVRGALLGRYDAQALVLTAACRHDCSSARSSLSGYAASAAELFYERMTHPLSVAAVRRVEAGAR